MNGEMRPLPSDSSPARSRWFWLSALVLSSELVGCAGAQPFGGGAAAPKSDAVPPVLQAESPSGRVDAGPGRAPQPQPHSRLPEIVLDPKQPTRSLPELKVENIGLHIGGGPNDAETKGPFLSAIAERFPAFMDCYRKNEDPASGGRFGIDLHIARSGGHPHIEQPRSALRGAEFRSCIASVFESVEFQRPKRGPTTISYSLRFLLVEAP